MSALYLLLLLALYTAVHLVFPFVFGEPVTFSWLITNGWVPHRNYWDQHTQGLPLISSLLTKFTHDPVLSFRILFLTTFGSTLILVYAVARKHISQLGAYVAALTFTFWHIFWAKNTVWFHDPILFTNTLAIYFLMRATPTSDVASPTVRYINILYLAIAGLAVGSSMLFKQTALLLVPLYGLFLFWYQQKHHIARVFLFYGAGILLPTAGMAFYFAFYGAHGELFRQTIGEAFMLQIYNQDYFGLFIAPPRVSTLLQLSLYLIIFPILYFVKRNENDQSFLALLILSLVGSTLFLYPQVTLTYAQLSTPLLALMVGYVFDHIKRDSLSLPIKGVLVELMILIGILAVTPQLPRVISYPNRTQLQSSVDSQVIRWVQTHTDSEERVFVCCGKPDLYVRMNRIPASRFLFFSELYARFDVDKQLAEELVENKPRVIVYSPTYFDIAQYDPVIYGEDYAVKKKTASFFLPTFEQFLLNNYRKVYEVSPTIGIWERR